MNDLTVGNPFKFLAKSFLPMFGSMAFQQMYNIAGSVSAGFFRTGRWKLAARSQKGENRLLAIQKG